MKNILKVSNEKTDKFGVALKRHRQKLNISQREIAHRLNVSVNTIRRWEQNKSKPQLHLRIKLVKFFGENNEVTDAVDELGMTLKRQLEKISPEEWIKFLKYMSQGSINERKKMINLFDQIVKWNF